MLSTRVALSQGGIDGFVAGWQSHCWAKVFSTCMGSIALKNAEGFNGLKTYAYNFINVGCLQKPRSRAKTEAHSGSSTLRAARAPWGTGTAATSDCRDFDLEIWGATHHRVPCRNSAPRRSIMLRWGSWEALKLDRQQTSLLFFGRLEVPSWLRSSYSGVSCWVSTIYIRC